MERRPLVGGFLAESAACFRGELRPRGPFHQSGTLLLSPEWNIIRICYKEVPAVYRRLRQSASLVSREHSTAGKGMGALAEFTIRKDPPSNRAYNEALALLQASIRLNVSRGRICYKAGPAVYPNLRRSAGFVSSEYSAAGRVNVSRGRLCYKAGPAVYPCLRRIAGLVSSEQPAACRINMSRATYAIRQVPPSCRAYGQVLVLFQASTPLLLEEM